MRTAQVEVVDDVEPCTVPIWDETNGQLEYAHLPTGTPCHLIASR